MVQSKKRHHRSFPEKCSFKQQTLLADLWESFWNPPDIVCPKCASTATEFYDPFFFAPIRTLTGRRRIKCTACRFIWRPSRKGKSVWEKFKPVM